MREGRAVPFKVTWRRSIRAPDRARRSCGGPGMEVNHELERGRAAFLRREWADAHAAFLAADRRSPLEAPDAEMLATAALLVGDNTMGLAAMERAHQGFLGAGQVQRAVRCAFWIGMAFMERAEAARAGGWLARARRLLEASDLDCVEHGYLLVSDARKSVGAGEFVAAATTFGHAVAVGERFGDPDLTALARHGRGRALLHCGRVEEGRSLLDEVMVALTTDDVSPRVAGIIYCSVIAACHDSFDLGRAQQWTAALDAWSAAQPEKGLFRGECLAHRTEMLQVAGAWSEAFDQAMRACSVLAEPPPHPSMGVALYQLAELHRLRGAFPEAEEAYTKAADAGQSPHPGLALLRLDQGRIDLAEGAIRGVLEEGRDLGARCRALPAFVEIMLAAHDLPAARGGAEELSQIAEKLDSPLLLAAAAQGRGAVLLADGDARAALPELRQALQGWRALGVPYEAARTAAQLALACRELGDEDTAGREIAASRRVFERLGAAPALERLERQTRTQPTAAVGLTGREVEVLALVATGMTNRSIAADLVISEKTVARHISNIFTKLGVSSRAAATAYAYKHDLA
jgi:DNA-binding CsgD family transcriptional regulator